MDTKPVHRSGRTKCSNFLYDEDTGAILGRTPESWGQ